MGALLLISFEAGSDSSTTATGLNNISLLLSAFGVSVQDLESALQQVLRQRTLENAIGAQLDAIGAIVGQPRDGLDDNTYRRYCRATVAAHRSNGTVEDIIRVANFVIFDPSAIYIVAQESIATIDVRVQGIALTDVLAMVLLGFLRKSAAAGVRVMETYGTSPPETWFRFDVGPGLDVGHLVSRIE